MSTVVSNTSPVNNRIYQPINNHRTEQPTSQPSHGTFHQSTIASNSQSVTIASTCQRSRRTAHQSTIGSKSPAANQRIEEPISQQTITSDDTGTLTGTIYLYTRTRIYEIKETKQQTHSAKLPPILSLTSRLSGASSSTLSGSAGSALSETLLGVCESVGRFIPPTKSAQGTADKTAAAATVVEIGLERRANPFTRVIRQINHMDQDPHHPDPILPL